MNNLTYFLTASAAALIVLCLSSCDVANLLGPGAESASEKNLKVTYFSGSCYGRCEVYTLELYTNGLMLFKGERFTERPGVWEKNIDRRRMQGLLDSFARADFANYPLSFRSQIPDAPTRRFTWYDDQQRAFTTSFKEYAPPELEQLNLQVRRLADLPGWTQVYATIPEGKATPVSNSSREEIIVQLADGVRAEAWIIAYGKQNAQLVKRVSPNSSYYVISADPNYMAANELLDFLRQDKDVLSAQRNNPVQNRN